MPNKDPNFWTVVVKYLFESPFFLACVTAVARGFYAVYSVDEKGEVNFKAILIDGFLCAMLSMVLIPAAEYIGSWMNHGLPERADVAIGVFIGYIGQRKLSDWISKYVDKKINGGSNGRI